MTRSDATFRHVIAAILLLFAPACASDFTAEVVAAHDGDTLTVLYQDQKRRIRLNAVDCPEKAQGFGAEARAFTAQHVLGQRVTIHVNDFDRYGRIVGKVILPDGRSLNDELVKAGYAWWYRQYAPGEHELMRLERAAREAHRGLWSDMLPTPPWQWRKEKREHPAGHSTRSERSVRSQARSERRSLRARS